MHISINNRTLEQLRAQAIMKTGIQTRSDILQSQAQFRRVKQLLPKVSGNVSQFHKILSVGEP